MAVEKGIDVAKWNGNINWTQVKESGVTFAILKITSKSNVVEGKFEDNYAGCTAAGVKIGGYRYVYAKTATEAMAEATALLKVLNGRKMPYGIWLDMEDASIKTIGKAALTTVIDTEAVILRNAGYDVGIYCNKDWYKNVLDTATLTKSYVFWLAGYGKNTGTYAASTYSSYKAMQNCIGWQYSSKCTVPGCSGVVDGDVTFGAWDWCIDVFGGSVDTTSTASETVEVESPYYPQYKGSSASIDVVFRAIGVPEAYCGSFRKRATVAKKNGISVYLGTSSQNLKLVNLAKSGKLLKV